VKNAQNVSVLDFVFVTLRGTLRQDGQIRHKLLVLCSVITLIYTSLYENTITSELIAPLKPSGVDSYKDLLRKFIINIHDKEIEKYDERSCDILDSSACGFILQKRAALFKSKLGPN